MIGVCLHIRFATIGVHRVAILIRSRTRRNQTQTRRAYFRSIGQIANRAASAAVHHIRRRIDFAPIGARTIAIAESGRARTDLTTAAHTRCR